MNRKLMMEQELNNTPNVIEARYKPDHWDSSGQVFFTGGKGWGITWESTAGYLGRIINACLGDEDAINEYLYANGPLPGNINSAAIRCLESIKELIGENHSARKDNEPIRASGFSKRGIERDRSTKNSKHRVKDFVRVKAGEKLSNDKLEPRQ